MNLKIDIDGKEIEVRENLVDRAVRYFNPERAQRRLRSRLGMAIAESYVGASHSRRSLQSWKVSKGDADSDTIFDLPTLRERTRDLYRNTPIATSAINTAVTNVVGTGLRLQSRIDRVTLGMSEEEASQWQENTEREFSLYADSVECDAARTLNFYLQQELAFRSAFENGDVFGLLPMFKRPGSPYQTKIQLIEADRVCNEGLKPDTDTLVGGVEKDEYGAPVRYHFAKQHPGRYIGSGKGRCEWTVVDAFGKNTGRRIVIHLMRRLRVDQTRGVPFLSPVIEPLKMLDRYTEAELMATVISAMFTVFIKSELPDGPIGPMAAAGGGSGDADAGNLRLASGAIVGLAPGEDVSVANPGRPNQAFDPFVIAIIRQIGAALEIPFEILIKHFTASYSASRAAMLEAWKFFITRRHWLATGFCDPVFEAWMWEAVAVGRIRAPGFLSDPLLRRAYLGAEWIGPSQGQLDPTKEVDAAKARVDGGFSTMSEETSALTGTDWESKIPQIRKERKILKEIGISGQGAKALPEPQPVGSQGANDQERGDLETN